MSRTPGSHYLEDVLAQFRSQKGLAEKAMTQLDDNQFFATLDPESNSIAIIIKHIAGNMRSRWTDFLTSDGEKATRHRDTEFEMTPATTRATVMGWWDDGWKLVFATLEPLTEADLLRPVTIRGETHTVVQAINRQVTHYSNHIGQIVFLAKHLKSSTWKSLSIPRGQSEQFLTAKRPLRA